MSSPSPLAPWRSAVRRGGRLLLAPLLLIAGAIAWPELASVEGTPVPAPAGLAITGAAVNHDHGLEQLLFTITVEGVAGDTIPDATGATDGAMVVGYVFPTTLAPADVGFTGVEGIVALAATSHPDFDDTPLWDENGDGDYHNDGSVFHSHWVVLGEDSRAAGGLVVQGVADADLDTAVPPTSPGLPIALDSPGFPVVLRDESLVVIVPVSRGGGATAFSFDAVTATMRVSLDQQEPFLGVESVHSIWSGDLSLPGTVTPTED